MGLPPVLALATLPPRPAASATWLRRVLAEGIALTRMRGVRASAEDEDRVGSRPLVAGVSCASSALDDTVSDEPRPDRTWHDASGLKGLESSRGGDGVRRRGSSRRRPVIETVATPATEDVHNSERSLLYVRTRAREHLLVTGVEPESELPETIPRDGDGP